jgi:hypothetical protein
MGNKNTTANANNELKPKSISQTLDYIATYYILTMDFKSLRKLYKKDYCDNLVVLTSDIIERYFTNMEITYLAQRIKNGVEVNETDKDKVIFFNRDDLNKFDIQNSVKKKRICNSIAKFYIKIAHIFAAIITTINPIYVYKDSEGNKVRATLYERDKIPINTPRDIYKLNICDNRIHALKNNQTFEPDINGEITIGPKMCNINVQDDGTDKTLINEPGIPELEELYYDSDYDFNTGKFTGMSQKTKQTYQNDLQIFYNIFTGNPNKLPPEITKFSDIKLRDYHKMERCQGSNPLFGQKYKGSLTNKLFSNYADNLKKMIQTSNKNQEALLEIINKIFTYTIDPQTNKKQIRIKPTLSESELQEIVIKTRALIIRLYTTCEMDYVNGLKIYEAIVEEKILETSQNQIQNLNKMSEQLMVQDKVPIPAELQELNQLEKEKIEDKKEEIKKQEEIIEKQEEIVEKQQENIEKQQENIEKQEENINIKVEK